MAKALNRHASRLNLKAPIFINDILLFIETTTLWNNAYDNTMYSSDKNFETDFVIISKWFYENYMVLSAVKCHFLIVGFNELFSYFSFSDTTI